MMHLPELTRAALTRVRTSAEKHDTDFCPRSALACVLNPPDGPSRLVGLPYTDFMTEEAIEAALGHCKQNEEQPEVLFWLLVSFACTYAEELPLQKEHVDAGAQFFLNLLNPEPLDLSNLLP